MESGIIQNRDSFLNKIARNMDRERKKDVEKPQWKYSPQLEVYKNATMEELTEIFKEHCTKIHTTVYETITEELPTVLQDVITSYGGKSIVTWNDQRYEEFGLKDFLTEKLPQDGNKVHVWSPELGDENISIAKNADIGITFSDATLAESGTVVLFSNKNKGRSVSFLPKTYIAIIPKSTIVPRMTQVASAIHKQIQNGETIPSCVNFISGPSNSADIEMVLIVGVHGPIKATYIIVNDK